MHENASGSFAVLTVEEFARFQKQRNKLVFAVAGALAYSIGALVTSKVLHINIHAAVHFALMWLITVWLIVTMLRFKCPRCKTRPMTTRHTFGGEVETGRYVALFPTRCHKCGVRFDRLRHTRDALPRSPR